MALFAKGLLQVKETAVRAFWCVCDMLTAPMAKEQKDTKLALLAEMQGVRRLSNLLCPMFQDTQETQLAWGMLHASAEHCSLTALDYDSLFWACIVPSTQVLT